MLREPAIVAARAQARQDAAAPSPRGTPRGGRGLAAGGGLSRAHGPGRARRAGGACAPRGVTARGFTLVELLVVVSVIALLAGLAAPAVGSLTGANARQAAGELAGGMRFLFDTAALRHATCRMALDLDERAWWAECAPAAAGIARDPEDDEDLERRFSGEKSAELRRLLAKTQFGAFQDRLVEKRELPGNADFGAVAVEGRRPTEEGTAYVYFFPGGRAQRAHVPVADGDNLYTVVVEPFTGRSRVVVGAVEVKE